MGVIDDLPSSVVAAKPKTSVSSAGSKGTAASSVSSAARKNTSSSLSGTAAKSSSAATKSTSSSSNPFLSGTSSSKSSTSTAARKNTSAPATTSSSAAKSPYSASKPIRRATSSSASTRTTDPTGGGPSWPELQGILNDPTYGNREYLSDPTGLGPSWPEFRGLVEDPIYGNRGTPGTGNGGMVERGQPRMAETAPQTLTHEQLVALDAMIAGSHDKLDPGVRWGGPTSVADIYEGIIPATPATGEERLAAEVLPKNQPAPYMPVDPNAPASYVDPRTLAPVPEAMAGINMALDPSMNPPLPRPRPPTPANWEDLVYGEGPPPSTMPSTSTHTPTEGLYTGADLGIAPAAVASEDPSLWDNVVNGAGKVLENTTLGKAVSTLFPDVWNGIGGVFKGFDDPNRVHTPNPFLEENDSDRHRREARKGAQQDGHGGGSTGGGGGSGGGGGDHNGGGQGDHNGGGGPGNPDDPGGDSPFPPIVMPPGTSLFTRTAQFPNMPPYRPGIDPEPLYFDYLNMPGWARGGIVGYADGGVVSPLAGQDPRVEIIAAAEDALHNAIEGQPEANDESDISKFVETFGADALEKLKANVTAGMKMRPGKNGRMVKGPGGPTDDAVPAVIDGKQPAALSSGEFVMSADAVAGAGEGDPEVGAQKLQELHAALAGKAA